MLSYEDHALLSNILETDQKKTKNIHMFWKTNLHINGHLFVLFNLNLQPWAQLWTSTPGVLVLFAYDTICPTFIYLSYQQYVFMGTAVSLMIPSLSAFPSLRLWLATLLWQMYADFCSCALTCWLRVNETWDATSPPAKKRGFLV